MVISSKNIEKASKYCNKEYKKSQVIFCKLLHEYTWFLTTPFKQKFIVGNQMEARKNTKIVERISHFCFLTKQYNGN